MNKPFMTTIDDEIAALDWATGREVTSDADYERIVQAAQMLESLLVLRQEAIRRLGPGAVQYSVAELDCYLALVQAGEPVSVVEAEGRGPGAGPPRKQAHLRRWQRVWAAVRPQRSRKSDADLLGCYNRAHRGGDTLSLRTLRKILAAGDAGLLDPPPRG